MIAFIADQGLAAVPAYCRPTARSVASFGLRTGSLRPIGDILGELLADYELPLSEPLLPSAAVDSDSLIESLECAAT